MEEDKSSPLNGDLMFVILQFLDDQKFKETLHKLEQGSGLYFSVTYFEEEVMKGNWDEVEQYLSGFTKIGDSRNSTEIFYGIRKQKYLEVLDKHECSSHALGILIEDMKVFATYDEGLFNKLSQLLTHENSRQQLSKCGDQLLARANLLVELKKLIEANPLLRDKLQFPALENSRLCTLINQSLNWQHLVCKHPRPNPAIITILTDHDCGQPDGSLAPMQASNPQIGQLPKVDGCPQLGDNWTWNIQTASAPPPAPPITHSAISATILNNPTIPPPTNPAIAGPSADFVHMLNRRPIANESQATYGPDELPKTVARTLNLGSTPMSMDFHPVLKAILLVGTNVGGIGLWDIGSGVILVHRNFKVWEGRLQAALTNGPGVLVNRVTWSPDGSLFGVAFSRNIVQLYSYHGANAVSQHLELDAHVGGVNDLAFAKLREKLFVITCGDDKTIKVWDATNGAKQSTFEGHEAAVYSVCPHYKENNLFIFSTALDGKIKAWSCNNEISRIDYNATVGWCTAMASSTDGSRLFISGTYTDQGGSFIVEWNEHEGSVKRTYQGFHRRPLGVVQFDTTRNRFLAVGDEFVIKFWDMDNTNVLMATDADGGLPVCPRIRFNKDGTFLAVSAHENGIKILANAEGLSFLRTLEDPSSNIPKTVPESIEDRRNIVDDRPILITEKSTPCRSLRLMVNSRTSKISRLIYLNSGAVIMALASNALHSVWRWPCNERNSTGKVTTRAAPQIWRPLNGTSMTNDVTNTNTNPEEAISCFAVTKNDYYVISASGGKISVYCTTHFKTMETFKPLPPAATFLALHPQDNNIIAIGMEDSTIQIYYFRNHEVMSTLRGHSKRITGLAFSLSLNVLVSSGADGRICVWGIDGWEQQRNTLLRVPSGRAVSCPRGVQFHPDQMHFLAVHESLISIYDATDLERCKQLIPPEGSPPITDATFSCDGRLVYIIFLDATVSAFRFENFGVLLYGITPATYLPANVRGTVYATAIAAHPSEPNQFALGLSDGSIHVLEPMESDGKWGTAPPAENASASTPPHRQMNN